MKLRSTSMKLPQLRVRPYFKMRCRRVADLRVAYRTTFLLPCRLDATASPLVHQHRSHAAASTQVTPSPTPMPPPRWPPGPSSNPTADASVSTLVHHHSFHDANPAHATPCPTPMPPSRRPAGRRSDSTSDVTNQVQFHPRHQQAEPTSLSTPSPTPWRLVALTHLLPCRLLCQLLGPPISASLRLSP